MARRTPEQNRAIYQRRKARAEQKGTTYGKIKYEQTKAKRHARALKAYQDVGKTREWADARLDTMTLAQIAQVTSADRLRQLASKQPDDGSVNNFWYHQRDDFFR